MLNLININYYIKLIKLYIGRIITSNNKKTGCGQVLLEYGIILVLVVTALTALQLYLQRGLQARYKGAADKTIREIRQVKGELNLPLQYEPYYQKSDIITEGDSQIRRSYAPPGVSSTEIVLDETLRTGTREEFTYWNEVGQ